MAERCEAIAGEAPDWPSRSALLEAAQQWHRLAETMDALEREPLYRRLRSRSATERERV